MTKVYYGILSNNRLKTLKKTINSILTSNIKDFKIIIYDSSSNKELINFLKVINNNHILVITNNDFKLSSNESYGRNRIIDKVLELSKGDSNTYLRFIDDDDYFNSIGLKLEYDLINSNNKVDMYFVYKISNNDYKVIKIFVIKDLLYSGIANYYVSANFLYNNHNICFDEITHTRFCEDLIFFARMLNSIYNPKNSYIVDFLNSDFSYYCYKVDRFSRNYYSISSSNYKKLTSLLIMEVIKLYNLNTPVLKKELNLLVTNYKKYFNHVYSILREKENLNNDKTN